MKIVKFRDYLVPLVLSTEKTSTWRLFDDKDLSVGDQIELREFGKGTTFASARITRVIIKPLGELTVEDKQGHESYGSDADMYRVYSEYYNHPVGPETLVKIVWFKLLY